MLNPRLDLLTDFPFDRLRTLLNGVNPPAGIEPLDLSLGGPLHEPPAMIAEVIAEHAAGWGRYPPMDGTPEFQAAAARWLCRRFNLPGDTFDSSCALLPVSGSREVLYMAANVIVPERIGAEKPVVLLPNPFYHIYEAATRMAGAEPVFLPTTKETNFLPDFASLDPAVLKRAALAYLCSPSNPQGAIAELDYLVSLVELARKYDFVMAFDECYSEIYDRDPPPGGLEACARLGQGYGHIMVFNSLSKRSSAPGLRSGLIAGDPFLIRKTRLLRTYGGATVPLPVLAASVALFDDEKHVEENRALYRKKFDLAEELIGDRFGFARPAGGFFLWLDVGDGEAATKKLWSEAGVKVLPGTYLARPDKGGLNPGDRYIRAALVHDLATTRDALSRLVSALR
ncbi:MAG: aminotransferase class I/II-fold pyridoxal phosphate-dependent enzyme [Rhodospirillales bacterium]